MPSTPRGINIRTCANCRHFEVLATGYEIGRIEDTRYITSTCHVLRWTVKEHYLFPSTETLELRTQRPCTHWEPIEKKTDA